MTDQYGKYQSLIELISDGLAGGNSTCLETYQSLIELISDESKDVIYVVGFGVSISYRVNFWHYILSASEPRSFGINLL